MPQYSTLGYSIYPSTWLENKQPLSSLFMEGSAVFTSLHISEEFHEGYVKQVEDMVEFLKSTGYAIIADVSKRTLEVFSERSLHSLAKRLQLDVLRIDYGFTEREMLEASNEVSLCLNASTLTEDMAKRLQDTGQKFYAMHNFYPRPETGLDSEQFDERNAMLRKYGIEIMAFLPGNQELRGPLFEGLPTLEMHRRLSPYVSYVEMQNRHQVGSIFIGDGLIAEAEAKNIQSVLKNGVYPIPVLLEEEHDFLYEQIFTIRIDSPKSLMRLQESREYGTPGAVVSPANCVPRSLGSITMDNEHYKRYSGEIQILRADFPKDPRVNVIGHVEKEYLELLALIPNNSKISMTRK